MAKVINFYLDNSGTRYPNKKRGKEAKHGYDWFALGGILVHAEEEASARELHRAFCTRWKITYPLHSAEVRSENENFFWLRGLEECEHDKFLEELYQLMREAPVVGLACVVDRPGYNGRYSEKYQKSPWLLCKTAFSVAVERAAKYARSHNARLRVAPERTNGPEDAYLKSYYGSLKTDGMPFEASTSEKYRPLSPADFRETLYEFRPKFKSSPMAQMADLYLWPICMGGYHGSNRTYARLLEDGKLIECRLPEPDRPALATKYSCFDLVSRKA